MNNFNNKTFEKVYIPNEEEKKKTIQYFYGKELTLTFLPWFSYEDEKNLMLAFEVENILDDFPLIYLYKEDKKWGDKKRISNMVEKIMSPEEKFGYMNSYLLGVVYRWRVEKKPIEEVIIEPQHNLMSLAYKEQMPTVFGYTYLDELYSILFDFIDDVSNFEKIPDKKTFKKTYKIIAKALKEYYGNKEHEESKTEYVAKKLLENKEKIFTTKEFKKWIDYLINEIQKSNFNFERHNPDSMKYYKIF